ncbi:hypothetical protein COEX109129_17680 [Corallococcus exiguus]
MVVILVASYQQSDVWVSSGEYPSVEAARSADVWDGRTSSFSKSRWQCVEEEDKDGGIFNDMTKQREMSAKICRLVWSGQ